MTPIPATSVIASRPGIQYAPRREAAPTLLMIASSGPAQHAAQAITAAPITAAVDAMDFLSRFMPGLPLRSGRHRVSLS